MIEKFLYGLIDFIFALFSSDADGSPAARWFRNLESKDGQEPNSSPAVGTTSSPELPSTREDQGKLSIKVVK